MNVKEFFVMGIVEGERCSAIGRCGDAPIRVGDVFSAHYKYEAPCSPADYGRAAQRANDQAGVTLKVEAVQAYGRQLDHLSPGMTGTLVLSGTGCQLLGPGSVLGPAIGCQTIERCDVEESQRT